MIRLLPPPTLLPIGTIDSQTRSSDGVTFISGSLYLQTANSAYPGLISTGSQTITGNKTFVNDFIII